jgi:hypothetical protein
VNCKNCYIFEGLKCARGGDRTDRKEAIALLAELGSRELVSPDLVVLELKTPQEYQLKIKGSYNIKDIGVFLKNRFYIEECKNYLVIFTP